MNKFPNKKFNIIYADPPWRYSNSLNYPVKNNPSGAGGALKHYKTMTLSELKEINIHPLIDTSSCFLFLWCTGPKMDWGIELLKYWGFKFVTIVFVWVKMTNDMKKIRMDGIGMYTQNNAEYCLLGRIGNYRRVARNIKQIIQAPKTKHSEKPAETRERIVDLIGNLPRIELFARHRVNGWYYWGNELIGNSKC